MSISSGCEEEGDSKRPSDQAVVKTTRMAGCDAPPALRDIIARYGRMVSSISRRMIRDEEIARDAAQEVWLEIVRNLHSFRGESQISTWIYTIATRVILNYAKNERIHSTKFLRDFFHGEERQYPEDADANRDIWVRQMCDQCLTGILHCLDNEARIAFILREIADVAYGEIACILDKDEAAVRKIISRSRRKLKNFLEDECILFNRRGGCRCRMRKRPE